MVTHYNLTFKGYINRTFTFDVDSSHPSLHYYDHDNFQERSDGYLYINGCRITNKKDSILTIRINMNDGGLGGGKHDTYVYNTFAINSDGVVILESHKHYQSKVDRFLDFLCGLSLNRYYFIREMGCIQIHP